MHTKILAVRPVSRNYLPRYEVSVVQSFEEAKDMIIAAEGSGSPYDDLALPVDDEPAFMEFFAWMDKTGRRYPFSVHGQRSALQFIRIRDLARSCGFHFTD
ncbi:MAG: hypothetical protein IK095_10210 [Oscillospiraceae bacterium]|nr:hypothetical protein [Oscillospiraceae bacterium]